MSSSIQRAKILFVSPMPIGARMAGPAIRCWELAQQVSQVADVTLAARGPIARQPIGFKTQSFATGHDLVDLVQSQTVLICQDPITIDFPELLTTPVIKVYDLYDPLNLETLEHLRQSPSRVRDQKYQSVQSILHAQLATGDFFLCANERQHDYWLGMLAGAGRLNPINYDAGNQDMSGLLAVVPMGISATPPVHSRSVVRGVHPAIRPEDIMLIWAGSLLDWLDPITLIKAMYRVTQSRQDVKLFFMASQHAALQDPHSIVGRSIALAKELGLYDRVVIFNPEWVTYDDRANYLLEADAGVTTQLDHLETRFSFRTRVLDYLWAGLPMISSRGDTFADLIEHYDLGRTVPPSDEVALAEAILAIADDAARRRIWSRNVRSVAESFAWAKVARPLVDFCRAPRPAPDRSTRFSIGTTDMVTRSPNSGPDNRVDRIKVEIRRARRSWFARSTVRIKTTIKQLLRRRYRMVLFDRLVEATGPLLSGQRLGQSFHTFAAQLSGVNLLIGTFGRVNSIDLVLHLQTTSDAQTDLAVSRVNAMWIDDCMLCTFAFPPISDSADRDFYFWIESPNAVLSDSVTLFKRVEDGALVFFQHYIDQPEGNSTE